MREEQLIRLRKIFALFFSFISIFAIMLSSTAMIANASEIEKYVEDTEVFTKNEQWIGLENEVSSLNFKLALANDDISDEQLMNYLYTKYDGAAVISTRGHGQRLQNGGWNVFYNSAASKQTIRHGYNGLFASIVLMPMEMSEQPV
jgi:hypothetical protein